MQEQTPIYPYSYAEAKRNGEADIALYRASHKANLNCKAAIERAISENFDGMHLNSGTEDGVISKYGIDRVRLLLANTLQELDYDGRFSRRNKEWGQSIELPFSFWDSDRKTEYIINSHPAILDGFIDNVRERYKGLHLWEAEHCVPPNGLNFEGKVMVLKPEILKDEYKNPDMQLFYCKDGFGCSPTARGRKVYGQFLTDGEKTCYERKDFLGELKPEHLPAWAKEKLAELKKPSIKAQLAAKPDQAERPTQKSRDKGAR